MVMAGFLAFCANEVWAFVTAAGKRMSAEAHALSYTCSMREPLARTLRSGTQSARPTHNAPWS